MSLKSNVSRVALATTLLSMGAIIEAQAWIEEYRRFWEESLNRLDEYLNKLQNQGENDERGKK